MTLEDRRKLGEVVASATAAGKDAEIAALKAELAEWEASKSHIIDIIHDSTAPFLARAEAAEKELEAERGRVK